MYNESRNERSVVVIGGGNGAQRTLRALRDNGDHVSAIITTLDNGGSTGALRSRFGIPGMGDIRRAFSALADNRQLADLIDVRFSHEELCDSGLASGTGHSFGNLAFAALTKLYGSFEEAVDVASQLLQVRGEVIPVTLDIGHLRAVRSDGAILVGETNIDIPQKGMGHLRISDLSIVPQVKGNPKAVSALLRARKIVVGPGDLFTSILPCLIIPEIKEAFLRSGADKIFVANIMTKQGETPGFELDDFVDTIGSYLGVPSHTVFDSVIINSSDIPRAVTEKYAREGAERVRVGPDSKLKELIVRAPLCETGSTFAHHSVDQLQRVLCKIIGSKTGREKKPATDESIELQVA
jgi:uncharacterized cofD-like protein